MGEVTTREQLGDLGSHMALLYFLRRMNGDRTEETHVDLTRLNTHSTMFTGTSDTSWCFSINTKKCAKSKKLQYFET